MAYLISDINMLIAIILLCLSIILQVSGHGSMIEPPARATMHDYGFPENPKDYQWMEGFCGGKVFVKEF